MKVKETMLKRRKEAKKTRKKEKKNLTNREMLMTIITTSMETKP